jgi:hypothetical protein
MGGRWCCRVPTRSPARKLPRRKSALTGGVSDVLRRNGLKPPWVRTYKYKRCAATPISWRRCATASGSTSIPLSLPNPQSPLSGPSGRRDTAECQRWGVLSTLTKNGVCGATVAAVSSAPSTPSTVGTSSTSAGNTSSGPCHRPRTTTSSTWSSASPPDPVDGAGPRARSRRPRPGAHHLRGGHHRSDRRRPVPRWWTGAKTG